MPCLNRLAKILFLLEAGNCFLIKLMGSAQNCFECQETGSSVETFLNTKGKHLLCDMYLNQAYPLQSIGVKKQKKKERLF